MVRRYIAFAIGLALASALLAAPAARSQEPPHYAFSPAPPGTVLQNELFYLAGQAMHGQWRAVVSKKTVGVNGKQTFDQWFLSIYSIDGATYRLQYQSPANGGPLSKVTRANDGAPMWFPTQNLKIVGTGQFVTPTVENLVTQSQEIGGDCGMATVTVFAATSSGKVVRSATVTNPCDLSAKIVRAGANYSIQLTGPYYAANAALCCPTKNKAAATLRYAGGRWIESPNYFKLR